MTEAQKFGFYLPVWQRVIKARGWRNKELRQPGRMEWMEEEYRGWPEPAGPAALRVVAMAKQMAEQRSAAGTDCATSGSITAEDLRHGCNLVATVDLEPNEGTISSKHLTNTQVNHVVALMRLLIDPNDLRAVTDWMNPELAWKKGFEELLEKQAPEGTLRAIFCNAYGTKEWREGNRQQLVWLLKQVKGRQKTWAKPVRDPELEPF